MAQRENWRGLHCSGEARAHVRQVFRCERIWRTFEDEKAKDGFGRCTQRRKRQKAADAYRKGRTSRIEVYFGRDAPPGCPFGMLEPYDRKLSRTVLRGAGGREAPRPTRFATRSRVIVCVWNGGADLTRQPPSVSPLVPNASVLVARCAIGAKPRGQCTELGS